MKPSKKLDECTEANCRDVKSRGVKQKMFTWTDSHGKVHKYPQEWEDNRPEPNPSPEAVFRAGQVCAAIIMEKLCKQAQANQETAAPVAAPHEDKGE